MERLLLPVTNSSGDTEYIDPSRMYRTREEKSHIGKTVIHFDNRDEMIIKESQKELASKIIEHSKELLRQQQEEMMLDGSIEEADWEEL